MSEALGKFTTQCRARCEASLKTQGIEAGIHYPLPLHLQPAYRGLGLRPGSFPVAEAAAQQVLSLLQR
jgi:dTDP-4-amino-4,6-dideoxygalactose transaminase